MKPGSQVSARHLTQPIDSSVGVRDGKGHTIVTRRRRILEHAWSGMGSVESDLAASRRPRERYAATAASARGETYSCSPFERPGSFRGRPNKILRAVRLREHADEAVPGVGFARVISVRRRQCSSETCERRVRL
jgi:hypothetical protein